MLPLLAGVYLGGLLVSLLNVWFRNDEPSPLLAIGCLVWPVSACSLVWMGRHAAREQLGVLTNEQVEELVEDVCVLRVKLEARERSERD